MFDTINLWQKGEYNYPLSAGFEPNIVTYIHEDEIIRPAMLIVPGGGYGVVSPTEGEIVAIEFFKRGFNSFVLSYTTDALMMAPLHKQPLADVARAIRIIRQMSADFNINERQITLCGFSAGGHLVGSLCTHFEDMTEFNPLYHEVSCRPDAAILSYPVILGSELGHEDSIISLIGEFGTDEERDYFSLEKHVTPNTPPCFIWHTATDETVPVENSLSFAESLREKKVNFGLHIFSNGAHGLSLANEQWASGKFGTPYTMKQTRNVIKLAQIGELALTNNAKERLERFVKHNDTHERIPNEEAAIWPDLAEEWLKKQLNF